MANQIFIDGTDFTSSTRFPKGFSVTYAVDDSSKTVNVGISSDITFVKESFEYLENKFFPTPFDAGAKDHEAALTIITDCCNQVFEFVIRADATTYCPEKCTIETQGFERTLDFKKSALLRSLNVGLTAGVGDNPPQPKIPTCVEFGFSQALILAALAPIIELMDAIDGALTFLGIDALSNTLQSIRDIAYGCNNSMEAFYIKDVLEFSLSRAGLTLSSSLFQGGAYTDAAWIDADQRLLQGGQDLGGACNSLSRLTSRLTISEFIEVLTQVYNLDYRIKDGVLILERRDFFLQTTSTLVNADEAFTNGLTNNEPPCYTYTDQTKYASGLFEYTKDSLDGSGNESLETYYRDRVEWNDPFDENKVGVLEISVPIGSPRFSGDGFSPVVDQGRPFGYLLIDRQATVTRSLPKIIMLRGQDADDINFCDARPTSRLVLSTLTAEFNMAMHFNETLDVPELYQNQWSIEDPRSTPNRPYELDDFEFLFTCDQVNLIRANGIDVLVETRLGTGTPEEIEINFETKTIIVKGTKLAQI